MKAVQIIAVPGMPEIGPGVEIAGAVLQALEAAALELIEGDVLVVTHKIVSKAEGRVIESRTDDAYRAAVEEEARAILRRRGDLAIARTRHGFICANAGVDRSNVPADRAVLLPLNPDRSAHGIRVQVRHATGIDVPVIISDTFGRPWRRGQTDVAIGVSGMTTLADFRGKPDANGRIMEATEIALVDEIASAADLVMGKTDQVPVAVVRGVGWERGDGRATDLVRPPGEDLFH